MSILYCRPELEKAKADPTISRCVHLWRRPKLEPRSMEIEPISGVGCEPPFRRYLWCKECTNALGGYKVYGP